MSRDLLGEMGPERTEDGNRASNGGVVPVRDVHNYSPPRGPTNINDSKSPGLHGHNCGISGTQGPYGSRGDGQSGSPGLHGSNKGMGTNRKG